MIATHTCGVSMVPFHRQVGNLRILAFVVNVLPLFIHATAYAAPVLDQSSTAISERAFLCCSFEWGQTFTAGMTGALVRVDVYLGDVFGGFSAVGPLAYDVRRVVSGAPSAASGDVLVRGTLARSTFTAEGFYTLDIGAAQIPVRIGDQFAIVLSSTDPDSVAPWTWRGSSAFASTYAGGARFFRINETAAWVQSLDSDLAFRTFVDPAAPVPTLAEWAMGALVLLLVMAGVVAMRRRPVEQLQRQHRPRSGHAIRGCAKTAAPTSSVSQVVAWKLFRSRLASGSHELGGSFERSIPNEYRTTARNLAIVPAQPGSVPLMMFTSLRDQRGQGRRGRRD